MTGTQREALGQTMTDQAMTDQATIEVGITEIDKVVSLAEVVEKETLIKGTHAGKLNALYIATKKHYTQLLSNILTFHLFIY